MSDIPGAPLFGQGWGQGVALAAAERRIQALEANVKTIAEQLEQTVDLLANLMIDVEYLKGQE